MKRIDWEPLYEEILSDMGYDRFSDESSARLLKTLMPNADLVDDDELPGTFGKCPVVIGPANPDLSGLDGRFIISAGSATEILIDKGIVPNVVVTDLDGNIDSQIEASKMGALTFLHAHGDNEDLIMRYSSSFTGPVILTTQATSDRIIRNYGGFTDGDRAVCIAFYFDADNVELRGFDFSEPCLKDGTSPEIKLKKLRWAEKIISMFGDRVIIR